MWFQVAQIDFDEKVFTRPGSRGQSSIHLLCEDGHLIPCGDGGLAELAGRPSFVDLGPGHFCPRVSMSDHHSANGRRSSRSLTFLAVVSIFLLLSLFGLYSSTSSHGSPRAPHLSLYQHSPTGAAPEKAVILASYDGQKVEWLHTLPPDWSIFRYVLEGREANAYLSFIIDHYHDLPKHMVFLHGHMNAWHQIEPASWKIRALNLESLERRGYINLRCSLDSGCTADTTLGSGHPWIEFKPLRDIVGGMMSLFWASRMEPYGFGTYPTDLSQPCCAQFAVTREAVLAHPLEFYKHFREPLEWEVEAGKIAFGWNWDKYHAGTVYEYLWHVVFGQDPVYCPSEDVCRREYFSDAISCQSHPGRYQSSFGWRNVNCSSIYAAEERTEAVQRVFIEEFWGRPDPESEPDP